MIRTYTNDSLLILLTQQLTPIVPLTPFPQPPDEKTMNFPSQYGFHVELSNPSPEDFAILAVENTPSNEEPQAIPGVVTDEGDFDE